MLQTVTDKGRNFLDVSELSITEWGNRNDLKDTEHNQYHSTVIAIQQLVNTKKYPS